MTIQREGLAVMAQRRTRIGPCAAGARVLDERKHQVERETRRGITAERQEPLARLRDRRVRRRIPATPLGERMAQGAVQRRAIVLAKF
jgi:hypothetical protein